LAGAAVRSLGALAAAPATVLLLGAAATLHGDLRAVLTPASGQITAAVVAAGIVLAAAFRRGRAVLALITVGVAALVLTRCTPGHGAPPLLVGYVAKVAAVLLPANLALVALLRERGALSAPGLVRLGALGVEILVAAMPWLAFEPRAMAWPTHPLTTAFSTAWTPIPQLGLAAAIVAIVGLGVRVVLTRDPLDAGLLGGLVAALAALQVLDVERSALWLAAAALSIVAGAVEAAVGMAFRDTLTGLPGRRAFDDALARLPERYTVAMVDIDHFKAINDSHGHDVGDQVLRMVAGQVAAVGGAGRAFRVGGEEFAVLFAGRMARDVLPHVEAVRQAVEGAEFVVRSPDRPAKRPDRAPVSAARTQARKVPVTVSIGVAESAAKALPRAVVEAADAALYRAKRAGRNRVAR